MKKIISMILVCTLMASPVNISFASEVENGDITAYGISAAGDARKTDIVFTGDTGFDVNIAPEESETSCIPSREQLLTREKDDTGTASDAGRPDAATLFSSTDFVFNSHLLTSFNTITGPVMGNGANEPKFSYNSFIEESISDYSGELTLNFEDLVLDGRNGLDLRIGRTYQTVASNTGEKSIMILPRDDGYLQNYLVSNYSTYLLDRYNLGMGWGFSFPSVQIETEYIPQEVADTFYYEEETELYYHSGNGEVYQVQFTADTTDSNLKGYYGKDIQFNQNDTAYSNGQETSFYSMTLADKTKQYFAKDGRLLGIADRFGNTIKFEHELTGVVNSVPDGNFRYSDDVWLSSTAGDGTYDAYPTSKTNIGSNDGYVMYFRRNNTSGAYVQSRPIQVKPLTDYTLGIRLKAANETKIKVEVIGYDTAYHAAQTRTYWITDYGTDWYDYTQTFSMSSAVRYVVIKITPNNAKGVYLDNVRLDESKPLLKKITDTVGRTVEFSYLGDIASGDQAGSVTLTVTSPDGEDTRTLTYNKEAIEFVTDYVGHTEQRLFWYLNNSRTEGDDGATVKYTYEGGATVESDGTLSYPQLYARYDTKAHSASDSWVNKPVLNTIKYKDRKKVYEYETVRKHLGEDGYYDTLRIKKKYDMYGYLPDGETVNKFKGEIGAVEYSYAGSYNGKSFDNETGYPAYTFDEDTTLNEQWTVTKSGKTTDTVTFSNCAVVKQTSSSDGVSVVSDYTNHAVFKNAPTQIKNTVTQNGTSKVTYLLYSYNDWGGLATETKEVEESVKNNSSLLEKYTTNYEYDPNFHYVTKKSYYNNLNSPQVSEVYTYDSSGRMLSSKNAVGETTEYRYENSAYPYLVTKAVTDDPMRFQHLIGGDSIISYTYDAYGLYPLTVTQSYQGGVAETSYEYDYITGDLLKETLPDHSDTQYVYYSDGRVKYKYFPLVQYLNGRTFYTTEYHRYTSNVICADYQTETPVYDAEQIDYYQTFTDDGTTELYGAEINFYDAVGNLKMNQRYDFSKTDENNRYVRYFTNYYHDNYDRLIKTIDAEGHTVLYAYDGFDRPTQITDSENNVYEYSYNSALNKVDLKLNTNKLLATQHFDLYGNVIKNTVYPTNSASNTISEEYEYDLNGNVVEYTNANGNKTEYDYDAANRLKETTLPNGIKATSNYSVFNQPSFEKIYDANGKEREGRITYRNEKGDVSMRFFNYDNRLVESSSYSSDAKGRITASHEGANPKSYVYDELDHPIITTSGSSQIHRRYNRFGEVAAVSTDGNTPEIRYGYDALGNLSQKLQNGTHYMAYAYSSVGNMTQSLMPSERLENYTYTANGNLDTMTTDGKTFDYDYYDTGYVKSIMYPNGLKTTYEYDNINRVTKLITTKNGTAVNTFAYEYDANGNTTKETRNGAATSYGYDSLDRLISVSYADGTSVAYEYDALNNRTQETYSNGDVKEYVYNEKYQLKAIKLNGETTDTFAYNASGAVISHNNKAYTYDEWDRLSGYTDGSESYTYKYDANGIRTQKNDKQYVIDINNNVVAETDSTGAVTAEIVWGNGKPLAKKAGENWYYYLYNAHGDVVGLTDESGNVVNTYEYTPWGEIRSKTETVDNPIQYAGEYYDDELSMIYLRARYYDPTIGRFTSCDIEEGKIANPLDMNRYVYCRNNPGKYVDPTGMLAYPGQIHNLVVEHIADTYGYYKEQTIIYSIGWGRADLISNSGAVWDVKRDKPKQIASGVSQVQKYVSNTWKNKPNVNLHIGEDIASGSIIRTLNVDTYYISYRYAGGGVIAYDYYKITNWETIKSYATSAGLSLYAAFAFLATYGAVQYQPIY